jgi:hypothetical protein
MVMRKTFAREILFSSGSRTATAFAISTQQRNVRALIGLRVSQQWGVESIATFVRSAPAINPYQSLVVAHRRAGSQELVLKVGS